MKNSTLNLMKLNPTQTTPRNYSQDIIFRIFNIPLTTKDHELR